MSSTAPTNPSTVRRLVEFIVDNRIVVSSALFVGVIAFDLLYDRKPLHAWSNGGDLWGYVGLSLALTGLAIRSWAAGILRKGRDLTIEGPYSLCRHPLYLGSLLMVVGIFVLLGRWTEGQLICLPVLVIYHFTMRSEEARLNERYAERWTNYAAGTPRLLAWKLWNYRPAEWTVAQWLKSREYQALLGTTLFLAALEAWHRR